MIPFFAILAHAAPVLSIETEQVPLELVSAYHGSLHFQLQAGPKVFTIWVDPWSKDPGLTDSPKADLVMLTDIHPDHLDLEALQKVHGPNSWVLAPQAVKDEAKDLVDSVLVNTALFSKNGMGVRAIAMYNLERGPEPGKVFHEKGRGNGYVLDIMGRKIYIAGDTECTPEMKELRDIDHAFIPMNLPYTMPPEEAAQCVAAFKPKKVTPYHYAGSDLTVFAKAIEGIEGVELVQIDAYPGGLPW
jgi:L-ascorbate metabolism protein UlaG (beta-lactamase superfamily)